MRALISVIGKNREKVPAAPVEAQNDRATLGIGVGRGEESIFGIQERHPKLHIHAVAATEGGCRRQPRRVFLLVRGGHGAAGTKRRLDINLAIGANTDSGSAEQACTSDREYCGQQASRDGHRLA